MVCVCVCVCRYSICECMCARPLWRTNPMLVIFLVSTIILTFSVRTFAIVPRLKSVTRKHPPPHTHNTHSTHTHNTQRTNGQLVSDIAAHRGKTIMASAQDSMEQGSEAAYSPPRDAAPTMTPPHALRPNTDVASSRPAARSLSSGSSAFTDVRGGSATRPGSGRRSSGSSRREVTDSPHQGHFPVVEDETKPDRAQRHDGSPTSQSSRPQLVCAHTTRPFACWPEKAIPGADFVANPDINPADQWRELVLPEPSALGQSTADRPEHPPPNDPVWDDDALAGLRPDAPGVYRIAVCITLYDEEAIEIEATLDSLQKCVACLRKAAKDDHVRREYEVVVVLIQDGCARANGSRIVHATTRELLELDGTLPSVWTSGTNHSRLTAIISPGVVAARAQLAKKVAGFDGEYSVAASTSASAAGDAKAGPADAVGACTEAGQAWARKYKELDMALIVSKGPNRQKHNSHGWFYGACEGLLKPDFVFLTDAGTTYQRDCLRKLVEAMHKDNSVVGTTGRQRAMTPGSMPGYDSSCGSWMRWLASPAMLQAFEFEATFTLNTALYTLLGMLPVLPGPCQLLRWEAVRSAFKEYLKIVRPTAGDGFIKALLRLAEDRVLSALVVLRSGGRTIWVPGATFYYPPEMSLESLIAQRRRWINGTLGAFLYVISDPDGVVDDGQLPATANPRVLAACWFFQMYQSTTVALSPAIFAAALQSSVRELEQKHWTGDFLSQARYHKFLGAPEMVAGGFFLVYLIWMIGAHFHKLSGCFCAGVWARLVFLINAFTMFTIMYSMVCSAVCVFVRFGVLTVTSWLTLALWGPPDLGVFH